MYNPANFNPAQRLWQPIARAQIGDDLFDGGLDGLMEARVFLGEGGALFFLSPAEKPRPWAFRLVRCKGW